MHTCVHTHTHTHTHTDSSYVIFNWGARDAWSSALQCKLVDLRSSLAYLMMTYPLPIAGNLLRLLGNYEQSHTHTHTKLLIVVNWGA